MEFIQSLFWNKEENRLRAGYRIVLLLVATGLLSIPIRLLLTRPENIGDAPLDYTFLRALFSLITTLLGIGLVIRFIDRREISGLGLGLSPKWWQDFFFGATLGIVLMGAIFGTEYALGWISISGSVFSSSVGPFSLLALFVYLILFISVGINEELITRGYLLTNLAEGFNFATLGPKAAIYISWLFTSILFGIGHLSNPNATLVAGINIAAAGIFLGVGYILTGRLGISIGLHITWNFFQGNVFGFPVSGITTHEGSKMISIVQGGPDAWTGGAFGPEAGIIGIIAIIVGTLLTIFWVRLMEGTVKVHLPIAKVQKPPEAILTAE